MRRKILFIGTIALLISINVLYAQTNVHKSEVTTSLGYLPKISTLNSGGNDLLNNSVVYQDGSNIGIGTTSTGSLLHIYNGASGVSPYTNTDVTIEDDDRVILSLLAPNNKDEYLMFGSPPASNRAWIGYYNSGMSPADQMIFKTATGGTFYFTGGNVGIGTTTPNNLLQVYDLINFNNTLYNTSLGYQAGNGISSGTNNTFLGYQAGYSNTTGVKNTFLGRDAGYNNTTMQGNVAVGYTALYTQSYNNVDVGRNVAVGNEALYYTNSTGGNTGINNTAVGYQAGKAITTGILNIYIGSGADADNNYSGSINIGGPNITASNHIHHGSTSVLYAEAAVNWGTYGSDRRVKKNLSENVPGLAFINLLRPVTYNYDLHKENELLGYPIKKDTLGNAIGIDTTFWEGKYDIENITFTGLVAQEVDSAALEIGYNFSGVYQSGPVMTLRYAEFVMPLIKAVQELSAEIDSLKAVAVSNQKIIQGSDETGSFEKTIQVELANNVILYQNEPNPFGENTVIRYYIPDNLTTNTYIVFYDFYGKELKKVEITEKGYGKISADTKNLTGGIYTYSLIIDGTVKDTKKMVKE